MGPRPRHRSATRHRNSTILVGGCTLDYVVPVQNVGSPHQMIPASQYHTIESGHVVFHERPDDLVAAIRGFITQVDAGHVA